MTPERGPIWAGTGSLFIGIGMGLTSTSFIVAIQSNVKWEIRGIATASNMFMRSLGSAIGVALLGGILNKQIQQHINQIEGNDHVSLDSINILLDPVEREKLSNSVETILQEGLTIGLHTVYTGLFVLALLSFIFILFMPRYKNK